MKNITLMNLFETEFILDGVEYIYTGRAANTRLLCYKKNDPRKTDIQISAYTLVQVSDKHAKQIKGMLMHILNDTKIRLHEIETELSNLNNQGVKSRYEN